MTYEEYKANVSFDGLLRKIEDAGVTDEYFCRFAGVDRTVISNIRRGFSHPSTGILSKFAAILRCSVSELVEFKGYDIKPEYSAPYFIPYDPTTGEVSYEPLRQIFKAQDEVHWRDRMDYFFSTVEKLEMSEAQEKHLKELSKYLKPKQAVTHNKTRSPLKVYNGGLKGEVRKKLRHDESVLLKTLYCICRTLGCPPDWVMSYK